MGKTPFLFSGQASQYPGMGKELAENHPAARAVFDEADRALGLSISQMCFAGTEDELKLTANTQPAILTCSVAVHRILEERGIRPDYVAGHSLGEYSGLVAAGALPFSDAVQIARKRGTYMQEAVPPGQGAMAAILGVSPGDEARDALVRQVSMPVRWEESVRLLIDEGVTTFVEVGPGRVLTGLLRQIERSVAALNVEDEKSLGATLDKIAQARSDAA